MDGEIVERGTCKSGGIGERQFSPESAERDRSNGIALVTIVQDLAEIARKLKLPSALVLVL